MTNRESRLFKNKYRIDSARLKDWDYSTPWWYYVTICTRDKTCWFGGVNKAKVTLSAIGGLAAKFFEEIPSHFTNIIIDYFVIMPNHIHGIVIINNHIVETRDRVSLREFSNPIKSSLSTIIGQYKSSVTRWARKHNHKKFGWQPSFYDHITRNEKDLYRIRKYIQLNPLKWELDEHYINNSDI